MTSTIEQATAEVNGQPILAEAGAVVFAGYFSGDYDCDDVAGE